MERKVTIRDDSGQDHSYTLMPHPTTDGLKLGGKILSVVGVPSIKAILGGTPSKGSVLDSEIDPEALEKGFGELVAKLLDGQFIDLVKDLLKHTTRDNMPLDNPAVFDGAFQANYGELAEALIWVIIQNGLHLFLVRAFGKAGLIISPIAFQTLQKGLTPQSS